MANRPYKLHDAYFRAAKASGLRARSAFKLEEISKRFGLLKSGHFAVDLGAAPGGFLQVIARQVGTKGFAVGIDIAPIGALGISHVATRVLDVFAAGAVEILLDASKQQKFDAVLSDLAPKTTGVRITDEARSLALSERALEIAQAVGKPGSCFVVKLFMGEGFSEYRTRMNATYARVRVVRPDATRAASREVYLVGEGARPK